MIKALHERMTPTDWQLVWGEGRSDPTAEQVDGYVRSSAGRWYRGLDPGSEFSGEL